MCACVFNRVNPIIHQRTRSGGLVPRFDKAHVGKRAESHVARAVIQSETIDPRPRSAWPDLQIQTGTVVMQANLSERAESLLR